MCSTSSSYYYMQAPEALLIQTICSNLLSLAVGPAAVIDETRYIPLNGGVYNLISVEGHEVAVFLHGFCVLLRATFELFVVQNFTDILHHKLTSVKKDNIGSSPALKVDLNNEINTKGNTCNMLWRSRWLWGSVQNRPWIELCQLR